MLTVLVVLVSIVWTEALLVLSGLRLSMVSSMLNSLITIIGVATSMHVLLFFREQHRTQSPEDALGQTILRLAKPVWWSIATTVFGFAVLVSSHINPVASFGLMMALGTMVVLVAITILLPGCLLFGRLPEEPPLSATDRHVANCLGADYVVGRTSSEASCPRIAAHCGCCWAGLPAVACRNRLQQKLSSQQSHRAVVGVCGIATRRGRDLGGQFPHAREHRHGVSRPRANACQSTAPASSAAGSEDHAGRLSKVVALTDGLDLIPERLPTLKFPFLKTATLDERLEMLGKFQSEFVSSLYNPGQRRMRLLLRSYERQPSESKLQLIAGVERIARQEFAKLSDGDAPSGTEIVATAPRSTGLFVLLAFLIESLMDDQWASFILSSVGITSMMWFAFRSLPIGLISLVPNLFPNILVIGAMGWLGLPINIATAMIACVSMGLTVDSSIIYIDGYLNARASGLRVHEALHETHRHVGRALVYTNAALMAGFSVLALSHFIPLVYFGLLVSLAMLGGLIGNLVFLPLLIGWWDGRKEKAVDSAPSSVG